MDRGSGSRTPRRPATCSRSRTAGGGTRPGSPEREVKARPEPETAAISRRRFLEATPVVTALAATGGLTVAAAADDPAPHQAMGTKVGEVTDTSAIVWTRLT